MKIYSVEVGRKIRKGITLNIKNKKAEFVSFEQKSKKVAVSIFYPDIVYSSVILPPVDDIETLSIIIRSRIGGLIEEGKDYTFVYIFQEKISENEFLYDIYALPLDRFNTIIELLETDLDRLSIFTLDNFSLVPFSEASFPEKNVFHFYGDEEKILTTISKNNTPLYIRANSIPDIASLEEMSNIYYENFNMTYMFATRNKRIDIDVILISGNASQNEEFINLCRNLTGMEIHTLKKEGFIKGLSDNDFTEYTLQIGTALLDEKFDFSPFELKKERAFNKISAGLSAISGILIVGAAFGILSAYSDISSKKEDFLRLKSKIEDKINKINRKLDIREVDYYKNYLEQIYLSNRINPVLIFDRYPSLFRLLNEKELKVFLDNDKQIVEIISEHQFDSLSEYVSFKETLRNIISKIKNISIKTTENEKKLSVKLFIKIERNIYED
ncbi:hypothetical protein SAMN06265182_0237 [Persephonella hydrogeniphila]|uniref:Type IV pilus assembly protein PilM n=1 Tax=Persephonella hydrogeniphila TaxID=198703 RepID=A0A285N0C9_9AQUI|nr:hypothetical protein [Persephonella hydrogeniphila]SNZ02892.1 hypothetical protein SAMN06265182_0237 [Persephonella hydrogeniphila]